MIPPETNRDTPNHSIETSKIVTFVNDFSSEVAADKRALLVLQEAGLVDKTTIIEQDGEELTLGEAIKLAEGKEAALNAMSAFVIAAASEALGQITPEAAQGIDKAK